MPAREYDASLWETTDGLGLNHENATIAAMSFVIDNKYKAGAIVAKITWQAEGGGDPKEEIYSLGSGMYEVAESGDLLETEDGSAPKMNRSSKFGRLVDSVFDVGAAPEIGDPFYAPNWVGTQWKVYRVDDSIKFKDRDDKVEFSVVLVEEYHGKVTKKAGKATKATKATAKRPGDEAAEYLKSVPDAEDDGPITAKLRAKLLELAVAAEDGDAFTEAAWELLDVKKSTEVQNYLLTSGDDLYAELVAEAA